MSTTQNALQAFAFDSQAVRVTQLKGVGTSDTLEFWFVAKDVCACLGIANHRDALGRLDADEKGVQSLDTLGGPQEMTVINESGLYTIILRSQGATTPGTPAHTFRKWVTAEVLPAIRKTGQYSAPGATQAIVDAKFDKLLGLIEKLLVAIPHMAQMQRGSVQRKKRPVKPLYRADIDRILGLRAKGYVLDELVSESGFSQSQCWAVISGQYKVLESGRVSISLKSPSARAADAAAKFERINQNQRPLV